jgi:hypothetical protein
MVTALKNGDTDAQGIFAVKMVEFAKAIVNRDPATWTSEESTFKLLEFSLLATVLKSFLEGLFCIGSKERKKGTSDDGLARPSEGSCGKLIAIKNDPRCVHHKNEIRNCLEEIVVVETQRG